MSMSQNTDNLLKEDFTKAMSNLACKQCYGHLKCVQTRIPKNGQDSEGPPAFSYRQVESNTGEIAGLLDVLSLLTSDANKRRKSHTNNGS